jgi:FdhD protein
MKLLPPTRVVNVTRAGAEATTHVSDIVAAEEPLDVRLHGRSFAIIMRTPGGQHEDAQLAAGFLLSERIIHSADDLGAIEQCRHPDRPQVHGAVDVFLFGDAASRLPQILESRRQFVANSACGVCGRATIDELLRDVAPLTPSWTVDLAPVRAFPDRLRATQSTFDQTGGLHGAAIFSAAGELLSSAEDVGRHNAVDKAVGKLLWPAGARSAIAPDTGAPEVLAVSGRVAFEIVQKAWLFGIGLIVAVSAPTSLAIELADEAGITLIGFARGDSLNIYTHPGRVAGV